MRDTELLNTVVLEVKHLCGRSALAFFKEVILTAVQVRLVSDGKLRRIHRRVYRRLQAKIFDLWDEYASNAKTAAQLLKACSYLSQTSPP